MKKKLFALLSVVLIVVMACSLAACKPASMFDEKYSKEATAEEAKSMWQSARTSMGADSASTLATASDEDVKVKGWKGIKMNLTDKHEMGTKEDGVIDSMATNVSASGAFLFDGSAMAITGKSEGTQVSGDKTKSVKSNVGLYAMDSTSYTNIGVNDSSLKVKMTADLGLVGATIKNMLGEFTASFTNAAVNMIGELVCEMDYDAIIKEYDGFKAYINDSGDYIRIKYVFTAEMMADMIVNNSEREEFLKSANLGECSIILVSDKETKTFQGAKMEMNVSFKNETEEGEFWINANTSASIENCEKVDSSMPKDLDDYKDIKDLTINEVTEFFKSLNS